MASILSRPQCVKHSAFVDRTELSSPTPRPHKHSAQNYSIMARTHTHAHSYTFLSYYLHIVKGHATYFCNDSNSTNFVKICQALYWLYSKKYENNKRIRNITSTFENCFHDNSYILFYLSCGTQTYAAAPIPHVTSSPCNWGAYAFYMKYMPLKY